MQSFPYLRRIRGIRIRLHYTWALAIALITAIMVTQFAEAYSLWQKVALGLITSLLFLLSMSLRSFALSSIAVSRGIPIKNISLFVFGGEAEINERATRPVIEVLIAVAGLLGTLVLCGLFYGIYAILFNSGSEVVYVVFEWLSYIFFMLFLFHLIPSYPLDGGRLLRALLWRLKSDHNRSIRITSILGTVCGWLLVAGGITWVITEQQWLNGLVVGGVGWVLQAAATQSRRRAARREVLQKVKIQDVMSREQILIASQATVSQLINECILATGQNYCLIADGDKLQGAVTVNDAKKVPKKHRGSHVQKIMMPASEISVAHPQESAASALGVMDEQGIDHMPVLEDDKIVGIISREKLASLAKIRRKLGF